MNNNETKDFYSGEMISQTLMAVKKNRFDFII